MTPKPSALPLHRSWIVEKHLSLVGVAFRSAAQAHAILDVVVDDEIQFFFREHVPAVPGGVVGERFLTVGRVFGADGVAKERVTLSGRAADRTGGYRKSL